MAKVKESRFTILDLSIMIIAALLMLSLFLRENVIEAFKKVENANISYVFEISQIELEKAAAIKNGTPFTLNDGSGEQIGTVTAITSVTTATTPQNAGTEDETQVLNPLYRSVTGTAEVTLIKQDDGFYTSGGLLFASGSTFEVFDGMSVYTVRVARIEVLE